MCCLRVTFLLFLSTIVTTAESERIPRGIFGFDSLPTVAPLFIRVRATTSAPGRLQNVFLGMVNRVGNMITGRLGNRSATNETQPQEPGFLSRIVSRIFSGLTSQQNNSGAQPSSEHRQAVDVNYIDPKPGDELSHSATEQESATQDNIIEHSDTQMEHSPS